MVSSMVAVAVEVVPTKDEVTVVTETEVLVTTLTGKVWVVVDVTTPDVLVVVRKHEQSDGIARLFTERRLAATQVCGGSPGSVLVDVLVDTASVVLTRASVTVMVVDTSSVT